MSIAAIGAIVPPAEPALQARAGTQGGPSFSVAAAGSVAEPVGAQQAAGASGNVLATAMLALQEAGTAWHPAGRPGDRQARQRGRDLLAALAGLQRDLLRAGDPSSSLAAVTRLLADTPDTDDPQLGQILGAIRLRAEIEAIRLSRAAHGVALA